MSLPWLHGYLASTDVLSTCRLKPTNAPVSKVAVDHDEGAGVSISMIVALAVRRGADPPVLVVGAAV